MPWPHRQMGPRHAGIPHPERLRVLLTVYMNLANIHWLLVFARNWTGGSPQTLNETPPAGRGKWSGGLQPPTPQKGVLIPPPSLPHSGTGEGASSGSVWKTKAKIKIAGWVVSRSGSPSGGPMGGAEGRGRGRKWRERGEGRRESPGARGLLHLLGHHSPHEACREALEGSLDWAGV